MTLVARVKCGAIEKATSVVDSDLISMAGLLTLLSENKIIGVNEDFEIALLVKYFLGSAGNSSQCNNCFEHFI